MAVMNIAVQEYEKEKKVRRTGENKEEIESETKLHKDAKISKDNGRGDEGSLQQVEYAVQSGAEVKTSIASIQHGIAFALQPRIATLLNPNVVKMSEISFLLTRNVHAYVKYRVKQISFLLQFSVMSSLSGLILAIDKALPYLLKLGYVDVKLRLPLFSPLQLVIQDRVGVRLSEKAEELLTIASAEKVKDLNILTMMFASDRVEELRAVLEHPIGEVIAFAIPKLSERDEDSWYLLALALRELYREVKGRLPETLVFTSDHCGKFEAWLRDDGRFSKRITIIDWSCMKSSETMKMIRGRLLETLSQDLGFMVVHAPANMLMKVESDIADLSAPHKLKVIRIDGYVAKELELRKLLSMLAELFNIFATMDTAIPSIASLSRIFAEADRNYKNFVYNALSSRVLAYVRRDVSEEESEDHIAMKTFIIDYLVREFGIKPEDIHVTYKLSEGIVSDVYVENINGKKVAIECETLFGTGPAPILKIFESVRKYINLRDKVSEVWLVIRPWNSLLHLGDLIWSETILRNEMKDKGIRLKLYTINISKMGLEPLDNILRSIT
jgi:hypothetical protein